MVCIFHQNMRVFGGGSPVRNGAYSGAFAAITAALPPGTGPISVAGFTEITNGATSNAALGPLCVNLGTNFYATVACGETALAHGPEFIGIGINAAYTIVSIGRILINSNNGIKLIHDISSALPPTPLWRNEVPGGSTRDYRGLVYVVIQNAALNRIAVGFLHNLYTFEDQKILVMGNVPLMAFLMASNPMMPVGGHIYIGGDFNTLPDVSRGTRRTGIVYNYSAGGATTISGNIYDYWYSEIPHGGPLPVPSVHYNTMSPVYPPVNLSDHAAITLTI
ncbi:hypothetical protein [Methanothrix harundinacea]|uniref:Endonuclease/exonuclease/phosphatase domain-containing protein n=1 Tax=Methanothrix harundinacea (strain 6Ac) TaxID=1110509 RepID=G7WLA4_METH6|nr:hypothetical protein [Methanothrix harundinacea]AET64207.1 hypothetical protein Mhar_0835 [Methanothrix harundinacea 6Ac]